MGTAGERNITRSDGPIFLRSLFCDGSEGNLLECESGAFLGITISDCSHNRDATVHCEGNEYISVCCKHLCPVQMQHFAIHL